MKNNKLAIIVNKLFNKKKYTFLKSKNIKNNEFILITKNKFIFLLCIIIFIYIFLFILYNDYIKKKYNLKNSKQKIIGITYGSPSFYKEIQYNQKSALEVGNVDAHFIYTPNDLDNEFKEKNKDILSRKRGGGYWLWKPYIILKAFKEKLNEGDYLIYTDAGVLYIDSSYKIINFLKEKNVDMWMNKLSYKEKKYTKRDAFILMGADSPFYTNTNQYMATIQVYKKNKFTEKFLTQLLFYSQDKRIITDDPNTQGLVNYPEFIDNRHDQTVLSLLIKKYGESNSGYPTLNVSEIKHVVMPNIFCFYRRVKNYNYNSLRENCIKKNVGNRFMFK